MKEKKGKKSLRDIDSFRSTLLKELSKSLPSSIFGANSSSISTIQSIPNMPNSVSITNDSKLMCEFLGKYIEYKAIFNVKYFGYYTNLLFLENGWYYDHESGYKQRYGRYTFNNQSGYLFVYFSKNYNDKYNSLCMNCYKFSFLEPGNLCVTVDTNQGKIFAVLIQNISQINALNLTLASQSSSSIFNRSFLSNTINDALNNPTNNPTIKSVIDDLRNINSGDTTPILSYDPVNPLTLFGENLLSFSCLQNDTFIILDKFINTQTFRPNSNFLSASDVKKLPFNVKSILTTDTDDPNKPLSGVAELLGSNTTIKFLSSGVCTIFYQVEPFNDAENIFKNPNGPRCYDIKGFSLRINARVFPLR